MKKKLFFITLALIAFVFVFAVSAYAVEIDGINYTLNSDGTATVGNNQSYTGETVVIPETVANGEDTYTVTSVSENAFRNNDNITTIVFPSTVTTLQGYTFSECDSLVSVYIDLDNLTYIGNCGLTYSWVTNDIKRKDTPIDFYSVSQYGSTSPTRTTTVNFANLTYLGAAAFQSCNLQHITIGNGLSNQKLNQQIFRESKLVTFTLNSNVTIIGEWSFRDCTELKTVKINSSTLTQVDNNAFCGSKNVTGFYIDLSNVKTIAGSAFCFSGSKEKVNNSVNWYNLDGEKIVDLSNLESFTGSNAFAGSNLGSATVIWPKAYKSSSFGSTVDSGAFRRANLTGTVYIGVADGYELTIDRWAFGNENYFDTVILGPNVKVLNQSFVDNANLKNVVLLDDSVDIKSSNLFSNNASDIKLYYKNITTSTEFSVAEEIQITDGTVTNLDACGVVATVTVNGTDTKVGSFRHTKNEGVVCSATCTTGEGTAYTCKYCLADLGVDETGSALGHEFDVKDGATVTEIIYADFGENGYKKIKCARCTEIDCSTVANAIYSHIGYSYKLNGTSSGIYSGFSVDYPALDEYEKLYNTELHFGMIIANPKYLGESFFENGKITASKGAIQLEIKSRDYSNLNCHISGFEISDALASLELVIAGYVYEGDDMNTLKTVQKSYEAGADAPVVSNVVKTDATLYTVTVATVETNVTMPEVIKEYGKEE